MADDTTKLTEEQKQHVISWLAEKASDFQKKGEGLCTVCKADRWFVGDHIVVPITYHGGLVLGGSVYPQLSIARAIGAQITCKSLILLI